MRMRMCPDPFCRVSVPVPDFWTRSAVAVTPGDGWVSTVTADSGTVHF